MRAVERHIELPFLFAADQLFNFVLNIKFASGFATGWLAHTWLDTML